MSAMVNRAIDAGITCFHTAPHYASGDSEIMLGRALGTRRKDVVVVTMCGLGWQGSQRDRPKSRDCRRESILPLVDQSLRRMQTDYIDVLQVHAPDVHTPFEETMDAMDTAVQQGKVRAVGVSNFTLDQLKECEAAGRGGRGPVRLQHAGPAEGVGYFPILPGTGHRRDDLGNHGLWPAFGDLDG